MSTHAPNQDSQPHPSKGQEFASHDKRADAVLIQKLQEIITGRQTEYRQTLFREMLTGILKLHDTDVDLLDVKILNRAFKELRHAFQVFQPYAHCPKVSIFGSARMQANDPNFQLASRFGRLLSEKGFMVITGAGEGIMHAGHKGAGKANSFGVNIMLPFEQTPNAVIIDDPKLVHLKYFFTRKLLFVRESHATALFPGGFGTLDEAFEIFTLLQTGKTNPVPIVCLHAPGSGYWHRWLDFLTQNLLSRQFISDTDLLLFKIFDNEQDAVNEIQQFYRNYHSIRFVRDRLLIRIRYTLTREQLDQANKEFKDLLVDGLITQQGPFLEEHDEPDLANLTRLVLHYTHRNAGRLRQLIDWVNSIPLKQAHSPVSQSCP